MHMVTPLVSLMTLHWQMTTVTSPPCCCCYCLCCCLSVGTPHDALLQHPALQCIEAHGSIVSREREREGSCATKGQRVRLFHCCRTAFTVNRFLRLMLCAVQLIKTEKSDAANVVMKVLHITVKHRVCFGSTEAVCSAQLQMLLCAKNIVQWVCDVF